MTPPMFAVVRVAGLNLWLPLFLLWALFILLFYFLWKLIVFVALVLLVVGKGKPVWEFCHYFYELLVNSKGMSINVESKNGENIFFELK